MSESDSLAYYLRQGVVSASELEAIEELKYLLNKSLYELARAKKTNSPTVEQITATIARQKETLDEAFAFKSKLGIPELTPNGRRVEELRAEFSKLPSDEKSNALLGNAGRGLELLTRINELTFSTYENRKYIAELLVLLRELDFPQEIILLFKELFEGYTEYLSLEFSTNGRYTRLKQSLEHFGFSCALDSDSNHLVISKTPIISVAEEPANLSEDALTQRQLVERSINNRRVFVYEDAGVDFDENERRVRDYSMRMQRWVAHKPENEQEQKIKRELEEQLSLALAKRNRLIAPAPELSVVES
ncbi:MAG: hypothetical protein ABIH99_05570 [Candidatus Micrarchaeota archaeon]